MAGWREHSGRAVGLPIDNVDTDQIIPARFMSTPRAAGYGNFLFHDLRHGANGETRGGFPLDEPAAETASILIAGRNFGSGSSREAAVYALVDAGFRAVLAPSFADIFSANAVNNGLLPATLAAQDIAVLLAAAPCHLKIDLAERRIVHGGRDFSFALSDDRCLKLVNGWDDIDMTAAHAAAISNFAQSRRKAAPWVWPRTVCPVASDEDP